MDGKPKTTSLRFSSERLGTIIFLHNDKRVVRDILFLDMLA